MRAHAMPTVSDTAVEELRGVYARMNAALQPFRRHCAARGDCCNFTKTGHMLYVTDLEAAEMARCGLEPVESQAAGGTCPYLRDSKCGAREHRGLGCRIYYCDGTYETERNDVYEAALKEIRAIEARHGIEHKYRPVTAVNFKEFGS
jgi:hypothetical protein